MTRFPLPAKDIPGKFFLHLNTAASQDFATFLTMHSASIPTILTLPVELQLRILQFIDCPLHPSPCSVSLTNPVSSPSQKSRSHSSTQSAIKPISEDSLFPRRVYRVPTFRGRAAVECSVSPHEVPVNAISSLRLTCHHFNNVISTHASSLMANNLARVPYGNDIFSALAPHLMAPKLSLINLCSWSRLQAPSQTDTSEEPEFSPEPQEEKILLKRMYITSRFAQVIEFNWREIDEKNVNTVLDAYYNILVPQGRIIGLQRERDDLRRILVMSFLGFNFLKTPFTPLASFFGEYFILLSLFLHHVLSAAATAGTKSRRYEMSELLFTIMSSGPQGVLHCFEELVKGEDGLEMAERREMEFEKTILCNEDLAQFYLTRRIVRKAALQGFDHGKKVGGVGFEEWKYIVAGSSRVI
ncbi:hypothetical protein RUND412_001103 [Rhizina undulata]